MRLYTAVAALLGWFALALQLSLMIDQSAPGAMAATIVTYFSFFTILTNILAALVLTFSCRRGNSHWGRVLSRPPVQSAVAVYIAIVGATYFLLLRHLWSPQGAQKLADVLLHDGMPVIYVVFWLLFVPKDTLRWRNAVAWLAYPGIYLLYILLRGAIVGLYPYPFIDVRALGYGRMLVNAGLFLLVFLCVGLLAVGLGRWTAAEREKDGEAAGSS